MFSRIYLIYLYICTKLNKKIYNTYYLYNYNINNDLIKIYNITALYYLLWIVGLNKNINVLKFLSINRDNIIIRNKDNKFLLLESLEFQAINPNGIIDNINVNIQNHRYEISNLRKNIYNIDKNIPLIFILSFFEKIKKFNSCYLTLEYKKVFNIKNSLSKTIKVNRSSVLNQII